MDLSSAANAYSFVCTISTGVCSLVGTKMTFDAIILVRELGSGSHWKVHKTERSGLSDLSTMIAEEYIVVSYVKADSTSSRTENDDAEELAHNSLEIVLGYAFLDSATLEARTEDFRMWSKYKCCPGAPVYVGSLLLKPVHGLNLLFNQPALLPRRGVS